MTDRQAYLRDKVDEYAVELYLYLIELRNEGEDAMNDDDESLLDELKSHGATRHWVCQ